jgi:hypothetical protein
VVAEGVGALLRTRSAHDFGAGLGAGVAGAAASSAFESAEVEAGFASSLAGSTADCEVEDCVGLSEVAGGEAFGRAIPGMFGTAMAVRVSRRVCCD